MINYKLVPESLPLIQEVRYVEVEERELVDVPIPSLSQIIDNQGKVILSKEYLKKLRDPRTKFNNSFNVYCSWKDCHYPDIPFNIEIYLQNFGNSRRWALSDPSKIYLPGNWKWSSTKKYCWRSDLWLTDIGQAQKVIPLLQNDTVYTVNWTGLHCAEDNKFCNNAKEIIENCAEAHKKYGLSIKIKETISSEIYNVNKLIIRTVGSTVARLVLGPAAIPVGINARLTVEWFKENGILPKILPNDKDNKLLWEQVGNIGEDMAWGAFFEEVAKFVDLKLNSEEVQNLYKIYDDYQNKTDLDELIINIIKHRIHKSEGVNYQSDCKICEDNN